jgi:microcystin-dependent protein
MMASSTNGDVAFANNTVLAPAQNLYGPANNLTTLAPNSVSSVGGSQAHNNMMPYLVLNFVIALQGIFPSQN